jgi:hypothetical protein
LSKNGESSLRKRARKLGFKLTKSRRGIDLNNHGQFMLIHVSSNLIVLGSDYDASLADIADFLNVSGRTYTERQKALIATHKAIEASIAERLNLDSKNSDHAADIAAEAEHAIERWDEVRLDALPQNLTPFQALLERFCDLGESLAADHDMDLLRRADEGNT